jgi:uncharacterized integral membrane protein
MTSPPEPPVQQGPVGTFRRILGFTFRHRRALGRGLLLAVVLILILQNVEPTGIDVLFWSFASVPKLILILASMVLGVMVWEIGLKVFRRVG